MPLRGQSGHLLSIFTAVAVLTLWGTSAGYQSGGEEEEREKERKRKKKKIKISANAKERRESVKNELGDPEKTELVELLGEVRSDSERQK